MSIGRTRRLPLGITTDSRRGAIRRRLRTLATIAAICVVTAAGFLVAKKIYELAAKLAYAPTAEGSPAIGLTPAEGLTSPAVTEFQRRAAQTPAVGAKVQPPASAQQPPPAAAEAAPAALTPALVQPPAQAPAAAADMPGPVITRRLPGEAAAAPAPSPQPPFETQVSRPVRPAEGGRAPAGAAAGGGQPGSRSRANGRLGYTKQGNRLTEDPRYPWRGYPPDSWVPK